MRRYAMLAVAVVGLAVSGVVAPSRAAAASPIVGTWTINYCWSLQAPPCPSATWTLSSDHTVLDNFGGTGTWSYSGVKNRFMVKYSDPCHTVYLGDKPSAGNLAGVQYSSQTEGCFGYGTWSATRNAATSTAGGRGTVAHASSLTAAPNASAMTLAGTWDFAYCFTGVFCGGDPWTLSSDHTYVDSLGDTGKWRYVKAANAFRLIFDPTVNDCKTTYLGGVTSAGHAQGIIYTDFASDCLHYGTWTADKTAAAAAAHATRVRSGAGR